MAFIASEPVQPVHVPQEGIEFLPERLFALVKLQRDGAQKVQIFQGAFACVRRPLDLTIGIDDGDIEFLKRRIARADHAGQNAIPPDLFPDLVARELDHPFDPGPQAGVEHGLDLRLDQKIKRILLKYDTVVENYILQMRNDLSDYLNGYRGQMKFEFLESESDADDLT